jgi:chromosome segregation protein
MLKRLEMVGFKSFADKTPFDFASGITAIVGPNGSGKSNIVDAVRWILGEQSAKSLRGGEMADVIFNGSTTRRSLGLAEVTMTFDNGRRQLNTDLSEVQITRRVYRDGQGEYLINQQTARLKDIKDLFLGSGAGTNAYCIIEQGRVENLLQSSTKDRRVIFEEAAGISRFKAKKIETLRRLERVEQNLEQLKLILAEVEKQLKQTRLQASKAQRFQEYSQRLRELRVALGLEDFHQLTQRLQAEQDALDGLRSSLSEEEELKAAWETELHQLDETLAELDATVHEQEALHAQAKERISTERVKLEREQKQVEPLEQALAQDRGRLTELSAEIAVLVEDSEVAAQEFATAQGNCVEQRERVKALDAGLDALENRLAELREQAQRDRDEYVEQTAEAARRRNDAGECKNRASRARMEHERHRVRATQAAETISSLEMELQQLKDDDAALGAQLTQLRQTLFDQLQERDRLRYMADAAATLAVELKGERSTLAGRVQALHDLVRRHEGVGAGSREVFVLLERPDPGPWRCVLGMVADFLTVSREHAPLIDLALGERAQHFVVTDLDVLHEALRQQVQPFTSRVAFLAAAQATASNGAPPDVGIPAAELVTCDRPELAGLGVQLLGTTRIVPDLATARQAAAQGRGLRFVTLQGEVLEADGTLTVGTHHAEAGILSRKSELHELGEQVASLDQRIAELDDDTTSLRGGAAALETTIGELTEQREQLDTQTRDLRFRIKEKQQDHDRYRGHLDENRDQMKVREVEIPQLEESLQRAQTQAEAAERRAHELRVRADQAEKEIRVKDQQRQQQEQECRAAVAALAQVEERLKGLAAENKTNEELLAQRRREHEQCERQLAAAVTRRQESQLIMLQASAALAAWYLEKETAERRLAQESTARDARRSERHALAERLQASQAQWQLHVKDASQREVLVNDLRNRRDNLSSRLKEDYELELADLYPRALADRTPERSSFLPPELTAESANQEIDELRRKKDRLGNVNLEALTELAELEQRAHTLQTQFDDLQAAQKSLQDIITRINHDSRKQFSETFGIIRQHFQELFRKLFGGGMADVVLEDENDILESGIEVIARPPGKELRSISLMSGGEKTLTAVALLLAIFRSKPSPFCLLDEVDAALDEANIGRFTAVLRDFLDLSQFILVTHSKKTMACADVLYGITMQESGISKRVAVRFDDWPDDGPTNGTVTNGAPVDPEPGFAGR